MTETRHSRAVPSLIVGIVAVALGWVGGPLLATIVGIGAMVMGGLTMADIKSYGYTGEGPAMTAIAFGAAAIGLSLLKAVLIA